MIDIQLYEFLIKYVAKLKKNFNNTRFMLCEYCPNLLTFHNLCESGVELSRTKTYLLMLF